MRIAFYQGVERCRSGLVLAEGRVLDARRGGRIGGFQCAFELGKSQVEVGLFHQGELRGRLDDRLKTLLRRLKRLQGHIGLPAAGRADGREEVTDAQVVPRVVGPRVVGIGLRKLAQAPVAKS